MNAPAARRLAWAVAGLCLVLIVAALVLLALDWAAIDSPFTAQTPWFLNAVIVGALGTLIATRRPRNPIGWLMLLIAFGNAINLVAVFVAMRGALVGSSHSGWVEWPAWVFNWTGGLGADLLVLLILFFPDGRLPSWRWRWVLVAAAVGSLVITVTSLFDPTSVQVSPRLPNIANPIGSTPLAGIAQSGVTSLMLGFLLLAPITAVVVRLRRATGVERRQLRWFTYAVAAAIAVTLVGFAVGAVNNSVGGDISSLGFDLGIGIALPVTIGLAVMKYGLYDIDVFISRTIVYGALAAFITTIYVGIAVGIGALVGEGGKPNLALSIVATAIVALGFQPLRERLQRIANRLVYGDRATPYQVLSQFSDQLADSFAVEDVLPRMARVLAAGTGAERADVWTRTGETLTSTATWPVDATVLAALPVNGEVPAAVRGVDRIVAVRHQDELLGALSVTKRTGESLTPVEENLLAHLAGQAGLVLKNVRLTSDLRTRLEELRASRQRLVSAQDAERRRLERNLHDGAQQHLVALKVKLGLAEMLMSRDVDKAKVTLDRLKGDADEALETLRDLARGIYPPLLADKGLQAALDSQARKATVPVTVEAGNLGRYSQDVEAAVYFSVLEALQNVQKYAHASGVAVRLWESDGELRFSVADDGTGFDVATTKKGSGLVNMADRLDSLGGRVMLRSGAGEGTELSGCLPLYEATVAADQASSSRSGLNSALEMKPAAPASSA